MKTTNLRLPIAAVGIALGFVALLFLPQALSVEARTSDESITGLTLASGEPGILTVTRDAVDPPLGDNRVNWAEADEEFPSWVALLFLSQALSVEVRTSDESITGLTLTSGEPGILTVSWDAVDPPPGDNRVNWVKAGDEFPSWQECDGNAFPASSSYTISNLEPGVEYKVRVRARYFDGSGNRVRSGPWSGSPSLTVAAQTAATLQDSDEDAGRQPNAREVLLHQDTDGPAVAIAGATDADFSGVPPSVTFYSGETSKSFTVSATDDSVDDDGESLTLRFGVRPARVSAGTNSESTVNIAADDVPEITVTYAQASYTVAEGGIITVTVTLSADPERTITIPITHTN